LQHRKTCDLLHISFADSSLKLSQDFIEPGFANLQSRFNLEMRPLLPSDFYGFHFLLSTMSACCSLFLKENPLMAKQVSYKHLPNIILLKT
jgi:hypothetical protein